MFELQNKVLGIIGLGTSASASPASPRAASTCACNTTTSSACPRIEDALNLRYRLVPELLATSDIVTLHVPLTATRAA